MKWTKDKSINLSLVCIWIFALLLAGVDIFAFKLVPGYVAFRGMPEERTLPMMIAVYVLSVIAWALLWFLRRLLINMRREEVFTAENVKLLRHISWCCAGASAVCIAAGAIYIPFWFIAIAAAFMMLIVRIVKNVFAQAEAMKSELDLTV